MRQVAFGLRHVALFGGVPIYLALVQDVPVHFAYQRVVLFVSLGVFGLALGQFWLSGLRPRAPESMKPSVIMAWHRRLGYVIGGILLVHPLLMVGRRFLVDETDPLANLLLATQAPALLPAVIAWILLAAIVLLSLPPSRRSLPARRWRLLHDLASVGFVGMATWHVLAVGRHGGGVMPVYWIALAALAVAALVLKRVPVGQRLATNTRGSGS